MLNMVNMVLILLSICCGSGAQLLLKIGGRKLAAEGTSWATVDAAYIWSPAARYLGLGLFFYALGALIWMRVLVEVDLGLAYPFVGLGFIVVAFASYFVLGEPLLASRIIGSLLIAAGCLVVALGK